MMQTFAIWLESTDYILLDYIAMALLLLAAFMVIQARDLLASSVLLGIFSLLMAICYLLFDAPDVALTEAAVGAGISTILFIGALSFTGRVQKRTHPAKRIMALVVTGIASIALIATTNELPAFTSPAAPIHRHVAPYYLSHTQEDIGIPNYVTAILGSYRGFDTLGEVGVIFSAGIGITALLMNLPAKRQTPQSKPVSASPAATVKSRKTASRRKNTTKKTSRGAKA